MIVLFFTRMLLRVLGRVFILAVIAGLVACQALGGLGTPRPSTGSGRYYGPLPHHAVALAAVTRTTGCRALGGARPDASCTPGAIYTDATVAMICRPGYAASVRSVSYDERTRVYEAYGLQRHYSRSEGEVDHSVALEDGGANGVGAGGHVSAASPAANLWPEPKTVAGGTPDGGYPLKDSVENFVHHLICDEQFPLLRAQRMLATDWMGFVREYGYARVIRYAFHR